MNAVPVSTQYRIRIGDLFVSNIQPVARPPRQPGIILSVETGAIMYESAQEASRAVDAVTELSPNAIQQIEQVTILKEVVNAAYEEAPATDTSAE